MRILRDAVVAIVVISSSACSPFGTIPVVGQKNSGEFRTMLKRDKFEQYLSQSLSGLPDGIIPRLESRRENREWELNKVVIGLGIHAKAGIGTIGISGQVGIKVAFTKIK